ncbi:MAG TPA: dockerin type I repeat-containing protein [Dehalococcoidia bacterium]|nr:dockerin type I repeat-containing protein [Dehalococcoidia bacterium]
MGSLRLLPLLIAASFFFLLAHANADSGTNTKVDVFVWELSKDYPGANSNDSQLPIRDVYIKTHDGTDWMSTYDSNPNAISGPPALQSLMATYQSQGIGVTAWFVPKGTDVDKQVAMAEQVIDSGVEALYADAERWNGFCAADCSFLATTFWARLRAERPNATLGVIYDPRPQHWDASATAQWLASANVALPMCYWESYLGQTPWGDPKGCVDQAHADLDKLAPGRPLTYAPILQGSTDPVRMQQAMRAAYQNNTDHMSIWRRGVTPAEVWAAITAYNKPVRQGDTDCDGVVTVPDAQQLLQYVGGLASPGCLVQAGDLNCDGRYEIMDVVIVLRYLAGLSNTGPPGCTAVGSFIVI